MPCIRDRRNDIGGGWSGAALRAILRVIQLLLGLSILGVYGAELAYARAMDRPLDGRWVFAVVIAGLSILTSIVYMVPLFRSYWGWAWDWILVVMTAAVFGIFAKIYLPMPYTDTMTDQEQAMLQRSKNGAWVDMISMIFWIISAITGTLLFQSWKRERAGYLRKTSV